MKAIRALLVFVLPAFSLLGLMSHATSAATFHVSPHPLDDVAVDSQFRTIGEAAKRGVAGDLILIHTGTYRESVVVEDSGTPTKSIRFEATPGATVVVTGADVLSNWKVEAESDGGHLFSTEWPHRFMTYSPYMAHPDDELSRLIGRGEQVFAAGYPLKQVQSRDKISPGSFFADTDKGRLYVQTAENAANLESIRVEASTRSTIWEVKGKWVQTCGITFRYAANAAQQGMARFGGLHDLVSDCTFEYSNGSGANFEAPSIEVLRCRFRDNGQLGWRAERAHHLHLSKCVTENNNTKNFNRGWEAGGNKIVLSRDVIIENSQFLRNRGTGIWFDIGNENSEVHHCLIADNEDCGLAYEISFGLHAHDNIFSGNGLADSPTAWGFNGGVTVSSSPGCVIERNLFIGNKEGFQFREHPRTTLRIDAAPNSKEEWIWNHDETIRNNALAFNRDAAVWGWFDVRDERAWPRALMQHNGREKADYETEADSERDFQASLVPGAPKGLSLEKLNIVFANNLYSPGDGNRIFHWGTPWLRHEYFDGKNALEAVRKRLGLESGSAMATLNFGESEKNDFRIQKGNSSFAMKAYPQGPVYGALTGIVPTVVIPSKTEMPLAKKLANVN